MHPPFAEHVTPDEAERREQLAATRVPDIGAVITDEQMAALERAGRT